MCKDNEVTDHAALDRAVEEARKAFRANLRDFIVSLLHSENGDEEGWKEGDEDFIVGKAYDLTGPIERAIAARACAEERARSAKLVEALESVHSKLDDAFVDAASDHPRFLLDSDIRDLMYPIERALAADREPSDPLREGR